VELLGTPGFLQTYGNGLFSYSWNSSAFSLRVDVRGNNEVEWVAFENFFDISHWGNERIELSLLVFPDNLMQAIIELTREMQDNNGRISEERAKEIIGLDYHVSEQFIIFPILEGVDLVAIVEYSDMVEHVFLSFISFYLNESLPIDMDDLLDLVDDAHNMTLDEFEALIGIPGVLWHYTYSEFSYMWSTPDITVYVAVNQNGEIFDASVSQFVG
jgi:hypothetical protein